MKCKLPLVALATLATVPATSLGADDALPYAAEVDSCIAAVNARLDLSTARRVRHLVSEAKSTGLGYALTIETSVMPRDGSGVERYEAFCVARGANAPSRFRLEEVEA